MIERYGTITISFIDGKPQTVVAGFEIRGEKPSGVLQISNLGKTTYGGYSEDDFLALAGLTRALGKE